MVAGVAREYQSRERGRVVKGAMLDIPLPLTVRSTVEGDLISTAMTTGGSDDRLRVESLASETTTRLVRDSPALTLRRPASDTLFRLGRNNTVQWALRGVTGGVTIDLSRDDGATWTRLRDAQENVGFYDWTGGGVVSSRARIRVTSLTNPALTQTSPSFSILAR